MRLPIARISILVGLVSLIVIMTYDQFGSAGAAWKVSTVVLVLTFMLLLISTMIPAPANLDVFVWCASGIALGFAILGFWGFGLISVVPYLAVTVHVFTRSDIFDWASFNRIALYITSVISGFFLIMLPLLLS